MCNVVGIGGRVIVVLGRMRCPKVRTLVTAGACFSIALIPVIVPPRLEPTRTMAEVMKEIEEKTFAGDLFGFGSDESGVWFLQDGFGFSEEDGTWMTDRRAVLNLRVPNPEKAVELELFVIPYLPRDSTLRTIRVVSRIEDQEVILRRSVTPITVALDGSVEQTVTFECGAVSSPTAIGDSLDMRRLCMKIIRGRIHRE